MCLCEGVVLKMTVQRKETANPTLLENEAGILFEFKNYRPASSKKEKKLGEHP